jgi:hypothetical protein
VEHRACRASTRSVVQLLSKAEQHFEASRAELGIPASPQSFDYILNSFAQTEYFACREFGTARRRLIDQ